jgi:hypothetical protein
VSTGTLGIIVEYQTGAVTGTISVVGVNNCDSSLPRNLNVSIPACGVATKAAPTGTDGSQKQRLSSGVDGMSRMQVKLFPNPTVHDFILRVESGSREFITLRVLDNTGRLLETKRFEPGRELRFGDRLKPGTYIIEVIQGSERQTQRVIKSGQQ